MMAIENKLNLFSQEQLNVFEELISKHKAKLLYEAKQIDEIEVGTFKGLCALHKFLFEDIYDFAGKLREVNLSRDGFKFTMLKNIDQAIQEVDKLPQNNYGNIIIKYVRMNIIHPFREGSGRTTRIWLDLMLRKELGVIVDWSSIKQEAYLRAMIQSHEDVTELQNLLRDKLTDDLSQKKIMQELDASYRYEGYDQFKTSEIPSIDFLKSRELLEETLKNLND